jgi:ABC-type phosphate transport system substrate-binding protein
MATLAIVAAAAPTQAHAAFALNKCEGSEVQGEGSSLQKVAQQNFWIPQVFDTTLYGGCGSSAPKVTFNSESSGCGLDTVGAGGEASKCTFETGAGKAGSKAGYRDETNQFGAADFAPNPTEEANIDNGPTGAGTPGSDALHVIPVAGAAITVVVHFPAGCALQSSGTGTAASGALSVNGNTSTGGVNDPTGAPTGDLFSNQTLRVHIPAEKLEEIWVGHITTWGQIVPESDFLAGTANTPTACAETPIIRIVRADTSGTTYNFKHYLGLVPSSVTPDGSTLWTSSSSEVGSKNTAWPLGSATEVGAPPPVGAKGSGHENECVEAVHICQALEGGGGSLSNAVIATNGSIGYLDLATAREKGYDMTPNPTGEPGKIGFEEAKNDHLYWVPLEPVTPPASETGTGTLPRPGAFIEPTTEAKSHFNPLGANAKGANCAGADYRGIPTTPTSDPTLGDWSKAIATGGTTYPICAMTYDLAFDDYAAAYNTTSTKEEAKARTVKDYLTSVVSSAGQFELPSFDYAALPLTIVEIAENGVNAIGWNKTAGTGEKVEEIVKTPPVTTTTTATTPSITPAITVPSNAFSIAGAKVKGKDVLLSLVLPGAGSVPTKATGGGVTVSNVTASVSGGQGTVTLPISGAALKKLAKAKGKKLSVSIAVTFTPTGGTAATQKKTLTITQASVAGKPKKKKRKK